LSSAPPALAFQTENTMETTTQLRRLKKEALVRIAHETTAHLAEAEQRLLWAALLAGTLGFLIGTGF
jgi:glutamine synthetase adenylyltransferase